MRKLLAFRTRQAERHSRNDKTSGRMPVLAGMGHFPGYLPALKHFATDIKRTQLVAIQSVMKRGRERAGYGCCTVKSLRQPRPTRARKSERKASVSNKRSALCSPLLMTSAMPSYGRCSRSKPCTCHATIMACRISYLEPMRGCHLQQEQIIKYDNVMSCHVNKCHVNTRLSCLVSRQPTM